MPPSSKKKQVRLECAECHNRNYRFTRSQAASTKRLELQKYCKWCQKHTLHQEAQ